MPDPNLDRLKAVSKTMIYYVKLAEKLKRLGTIDTYQSIKAKDVLTIKDDLLRLAEEKREAYNKGHTDGWSAACEEIDNPVNIRKPPASAGSAKTEEE